MPIQIPPPANGSTNKGADTELRVAVVGNPNAGKTTLFNALTGLRQKVGNYPGVTVDRKEGAFTFGKTAFRLIDLPGAYSLTATSDDERIVRDMLLGLLGDESPGDIVLAVVDAANLDRELFIVTQILDLEIPTVVALTMNDLATGQGRRVDPKHLQQHLGIPVVEVVAPHNKGITDLKQALLDVAGQPAAAPPWSIGDKVLGAVDTLADELQKHHPGAANTRRQLAVQLLLYPDLEHPLMSLPGIADLATKLRGGLEGEGVEWRQAEAQGRYKWISEAAGGARDAARDYRPNLSDRVDQVLTHPVWGLVVFIAVMAVVFQSIFTWAGPLMDGIDSFFGWLGGLIEGAMPAGPLRGLIVDGVLAGVGGVLIFLPQILLLFLFIAILEDVGYMARAAFLMNRHMRRAGLHGRSFIPMLSGFACSIPGIMAARTIPDRRDKLVTMLVVPLISCSARLPVYALMIAAFIPALPIFGGFKHFTLQGVVLLTAYMISIAAAITMAFVFRKTLFRGETKPFLLELPSYKRPDWRTVLNAMWERGKLFVTQAGTIILAINIILWFLLTFPVDKAVTTEFSGQRTIAQANLSGTELTDRLAEIDSQESSALLRASFAGRLGRVIEPAIEPLGFDWRIGVGIIGSLAAREVFISTLAVIYGIGEEEDTPLVQKIQAEFGPLTGISIIIFFILSCQCLATVAVMRREAGGIKWALFLYGYMTILAYIASLVFYQAAIRIWPELI